MMKVDDKPIKVPHLIMQRLIQEYGETPVLLIMNPITKIIRTIPTTSKRVIKIIIHSSLTCVDTYKNFEPFFVAEKLKAYYTTNNVCWFEWGIITPKDDFIMELYLDPDSIDYSLEEFKQKIEQVEGVLYVEISDISEMDDDMLSLSLRETYKIRDEAEKIRRDKDISKKIDMMVKLGKLARKIVLMALAESGKITFCKKLLNEKWRPKGEEPYLAIIDYEIHQRVLRGTQFTFFNLGEQTAFLDRFIGELAEFIFSNTASLVFIVDALNLPEIQRAKYYFDRALDRIQQYSPNALIFLLITKMDKIPLDLKEEVIQSIEEYMLKSVNHDVRVFSTSIFDDSSTQAAEAILRANL